MFRDRKMYMLILIVIALSGCGGSNSTSHTGFVIDAPVSNLSYKCGNRINKTQSNGKFECTVLPVTFFIGELELGSVNNINTDSKVFVQDIVKVKRDDFKSNNVLKMAILLQSLDTDKSNVNVIQIPNDVSLSSSKKFADLNLTELNSILSTAGITAVSSQDAEQHLREFSDIDTLAPVLTLKGEGNISIFVNDTYSELGADVKDDRDKNLTVTVTGRVKTDITGNYTLRYNVMDKAGNKAKELTRIVNVKEKLPTLMNAVDTVITNGANITPIAFTNSGGKISSCSISPALPEGLTLESNCTINGKVTVNKHIAQYTVTAVNESGSVTATVNLTINIPYTANDDLLPDQWYIKNSGTAPETWGKFTNLTKNADMNVTSAWSQGASGQGIVVTVVDDGADFTHPDLINQEKKGYLYDFETNSATELTLPITDDDNMTDHGTACAGIIAAQGNNGGVVGIAPNAKLTAHRLIEISQPVPDSNSYDKIRDDNISQVSNHSYGPFDLGRLNNMDIETYDSIKALVSSTNDGKGHVMLFSSGNGRTYVPRDYQPSEVNVEHSDYDGIYTVKQNYGDNASLDMTIQHPYVIAVSGFNANDEEVSYAEAGPSVLVAGATANTKPEPIVSPDNNVSPSYRIDVSNAEKLPSAAIATTGRTQISYAEITETFRDNQTDEPTGYNFRFNGTSAAAPMVTGVVALMRSANPNLTWRDVRWILAKTARKIQLDKTVINQATGKHSEGEFAIPYWSENGNDIFGRYSHYFGYGAADAGAAVALAKSPEYKLLPPLKECNVQRTVNLEEEELFFVIPKGCPNTIEFVQMNYSVSQGANTNDATVSIALNENFGKSIEMLSPSTCQQEGACIIPFPMNFTAGTVGFLGDALKEGDRFDLDYDEITPDKLLPNYITIMGYDK